MVFNSVQNRAAILFQCNMFSLPWGMVTICLCFLLCLDVLSGKRIKFPVIFCQFCQFSLPQLDSLIHLKSSYKGEQPHCPNPHIKRKKLLHLLGHVTQDPNNKDKRYTISCFIGISKEVYRAQQKAVHISLNYITGKKKTGDNNCFPLRTELWSIPLFISQQALLLKSSG